MAVNSRLLALLVRSRVEYELFPHREAFTAQEVAQTSHLRGRQLAKVVLVRSGRDRYLMAIVPASSHVDLAVLGRITGHKDLVLANEGEIQRMFPDCEIGAMPPFGSLYVVPACLDACFVEQDHIAFQAGNHHEVIRMAFPDFARLAGPFAHVQCLHAAPAMSPLVERT